MANYGSLEELVVSGKGGISFNDGADKLLVGNTYDTAVIRISTKIDTNLLLLRRYLNVVSFSVDVIADEECNQENKDGMLGYISNLAGGQCEKDLISEKFEECKAKGFDGMHVIARLTYDSMPNNDSKARFHPGSYGEAIVNGLKAYYRFQRPNELFDTQDVRLRWFGDLKTISHCFLVLVYKIEELERNVRLPLLGAPCSLPTTTIITPSKRMRSVIKENTEENGSPIQPKKRRRTGKCTSQYKQIEEENQKNMDGIAGEEKNIPDIWYSPDIKLHPSPKQFKQQQLDQEPQQQQEKQEQQFNIKPVNQSKASPQITKQKSRKKEKENEMKTEDVEEELPFEFEKIIPRGKGRRHTTTITSGRKSMLFPQWSDENKEEVLRFFMTLNQKETEQSRIALTCKFASIRFGQELPSKLLYQMIAKSTISPKSTTHHSLLLTLPGGDGGELQVGRKLFLSLGKETTESKRVAFTCRYMKIQYGVEISSKELFGTLKDGRKKKERR